MATTANQVLKMRNARRRVAYKVAAGISIPEGTLVFLTTAGYATNVIATGANILAGVATKACDNTNGQNGDVEVEVWAEGEFELPGSGFTQSIVGEVIYASDNWTVTATSTNNTKIGMCTRFVSATAILVEIGRVQG